MSLLSKSFILLTALASMTAAASDLAFADASTVPAYPCYKCVGNGVVTNPTSACQAVNTEQMVDIGYTHCTTYGWENGSTTCETSGQMCVWIGWISTTGTGIADVAAGVLGDSEIDTANCSGQILAWAGDRSMAPIVESLTL